jgi:uncharacterized membrane protein
MYKSRRNVYSPELELGLILNGGSLLYVLVILGSHNDLYFLRLLQALLGIPYALLALGYLLQLILFPRREDLNWDNRLALSFGLSIAIVAPLPIILFHFQGNLSLVLFTTTWFALLFLFVVITALRQIYIVPEKRARLRWSISVCEVWENETRSGRMLLILLSVSLLISLVAGFGLAVLPLPSSEFTEFYILGEDGMGENYPYTLVINQPAQITLGIINQENKAMLYTVEAQDETGVIGQDGPFVLDDQESTEFQFTFYPASGGEKVEINFYLFRFGITEPHSTTRLIADVLETPD